MLKGEISTDILQDFVLALHDISDVAKVFVTSDGVFSVVRDSKKAMKLHVALRKEAFNSYKAKNSNMVVLLEDIQNLINIARNYKIEVIGIDFDGKDTIDFITNLVHRKVICLDPKYGEEIPFEPPKKWDVDLSIDSYIFELFLRHAIMVSELATFSATKKGIVFITNDANATVNLVLKKADKKVLKRLKVNNDAKSFYGLDYLTVGSRGICRNTPMSMSFNNAGQLILSSSFAEKKGIVECWLAPKTVTQTIEAQPPSPSPQGK